MKQAMNMVPAEAALSLAKRTEEAIEAAEAKAAARAAGEPDETNGASFDALNWSPEDRKARRALRAEGTKRIEEKPSVLEARFAQGRDWAALKAAGYAGGALGADKKWKALAERAADGRPGLLSFMLGVCAGKALMLGDDAGAELACAMGGDPERALSEITDDAEGSLADMALAKLMALRPECSWMAAKAAAEAGWEDGVRAAVEFGSKEKLTAARLGQAARLLKERGSKAEDVAAWAAQGEAAEIATASRQGVARAKRSKAGRL